MRLKFLETSTGSWFSYLAAGVGTAIPVDRMSDVVVFPGDENKDAG